MSSRGVREPTSTRYQAPSGPVNVPLEVIEPDPPAARTFWAALILGVPWLAGLAACWLWHVEQTTWLSGVRTDMAWFCGGWAP
jgi:hypothetical protein